MLDTQLTVNRIPEAPPCPEDQVKAFIREHGSQKEAVTEAVQIEDERLRVAIAKALAVENGFNLCNEIKSFKISSEVERVEIAKIVILNNRWTSSKSIVDNFNIQNQETRLGLVRLTILSNAEDAVKAFAEPYDPTREEDFVAILKFAAARDGRSIAHNIKEYQISREEDRIEIAKIAAAHFNESYDDLVEEYGGHDDYSIYLTLNNFDITDDNSRIDIIKIAAKQNAAETSKHIKKYGIRDEEALTEIALSAAEASGGGISEHIKEYGISDKKILLKIARVAAKACGRNLSCFIKEYEIEDQDTLTKIAETALSSGRSRVSEYIRNYGIKDKDSRLKLAMLAAKNDYTFPEHVAKFQIRDSNSLETLAFQAARSGNLKEHIDNFRVADEKVRIELFQIQVDNPSPLRSLSQHMAHYRITDTIISVELARKLAALDSDFSKHIKSFNITDQKTLEEIAAIVIASHPSSLARDIKNFGITDKQILGDLALQAAKNTDWGFASGIENFGLTDQALLTEIAKVCAAKSSGLFSLNLHKFGITDQDCLISIARTAIEAHGVDALRGLERYGIKDPKALYNLTQMAFLSISDQDQLDSFIGATDWIQNNYPDFITSLLSDIDKLSMRNKIPALGKLLIFLSQGINSSNSLNPSEFSELPPAKRLQKLVSILSESKPGMEWMSKFAEALNSELNSELECSWILGILLAEPELRESNLQGTELSRQALKQYSGINPDFTRAHNLSSLKNIYFELIETQNSFEEVKLSDLVNLDISCWRNSSSRKSLLNVFCLIRSLKAFGVNTLSPDSKPLPLHADNLKTVELELTGKLGEAFSRTLDLEEESNGEQVFQLQKKWSSLLPIQILYSRLKDKSDWNSEIPVLKEILTHVLKNSFKEYKYRDLEEILTISEKQACIWRDDNPNTLRYIAHSPVSTDHALQTAKDVLESNLLQHLPHHVLEQLPLLEFKDMDTDLSLALKGIPTEEKFRLCIFSLKKNLEIGSKDGALEAVNILRDNLEKFLADKHGYSPMLRQQLAEDIKSIKETLKPRRSSRNKNSLIFSTITDDPKLLLTVGDLVKTSSCQNYRTGSHIQTLPAYVIDANIKVALSFVIPSEQLTLNPWLKETDDVDLNFNAPRLELTLSTKAENQSITISLKQAFSRRILRLGNYQEDLALFTERAYTQHHEKSPEMARIELELIEAYCRMLQTKKDCPAIKFPASRNPAGVYSDGAGGIMKDCPYKIETS